jgi:uncharacterized membrane protein
MEATEVTIILGAMAGLFATIAGVFFKYMSNREKANAIERKEDNERFAVSLSMFGKMLDDNSKSNREVAEATKQAAKEAKDRNGHLAELQLKSQEMIDRNAAIYEKGMKEILCQKVKKQTVNEQVIKHIKE